MRKCHQFPYFPHYLEQLRSQAFAERALHPLRPGFIYMRPALHQLKLIQIRLPCQRRYSVRMYLHIWGDMGMQLFGAITALCFLWF